ncbi:hypothetical protein ABAC402_02550 [Asticcacaulis sp. AC402]|nr:hypothetical protein ABAC402_02550 [Asticcacaulis sp. AC402]
MEYTYNFLDYYFIEDEQQITARHYLDQPDEVSVDVTSHEGLQTEFAQKVLVLLGMRCSNITRPGDEGYKTLPSAIASKLTERIHAHVKVTGAL